jgi:type II secretory pathway pseudopilin PulG
MRLALRPAALAAFAILGLLRSGHAEPPAPFALEAHVPATALGFASLEGLGSWGERWKQTAIHKAAQDPEIQAFVAPILEDANAVIQGMMGENLGPDAKAGLDLVAELEKAVEGLRGQVAVSVFGDLRSPTVVASLDFGDHVSDFVAFLKRAQGALAERFGQSPFRAEEAGGRTWWLFGEPGLEQAFGSDVGSAILLSTSREWVAAVAAGGAPGAATLAASSAFQETKNRANVTAAGGWLFANVPQIAAAIPMDADDRRIAAALGLDTLQGFAYSMSFSGDGFLDTIVLHAPGADHGIVPLLRTKPTQHPLLGLVPRNAFFYEAGDGPAWRELLPKIRALIAAVDPDAIADVDAVLAKARAAIGVDVEKDVLGGLGGDYALYGALPDTGGLYPEVVFFSGLADPSTFEATFSKAVDGLAGAVTEEGEVLVSQRVLEYRGQRLHVVDLTMAQGDDPAPFTPTWTILRDRLVVTLVPHTMKELVLRSQESTSAPGLGGEEDFRALLAAAPPDHGDLGYFDLQALVSLLYDTGVPVLQTVVKKNMLKDVPVRIDWAQLPATRTLRPHFRSVATYFTGDDAGARLSIHAPLPAMGLFAVGAAAAIPLAMERRRETADRERRRAEEAAEEATKEAEEAGRMPGGVREGAVAEVALDDLSSKLLAHGKAMGRLPASLEELVGPGKVLTELPRDPWGTPIRYKATDRAESVFELRSAGANRTFGDTDDVVKQYESD